MFGLIFLAISVLNEIPPEEGPDVKYSQFAEVASTNDDLEDLQNIRNLGYYNGDYYWAGIDSTNFKIYKCTGLTGTTSTVHTYDLSGHTGIGTYTGTNEILCRALKFNDDWFIVVAISFYDENPVHAVYVGVYNATDDNAWIDISAQDGAADAYHLIDLFTVTETEDMCQLLAYSQPVGNDVLTLWDIDESLGTAAIIDTDATIAAITSAGVYGGYVVNSLYYFIYAFSLQCLGQHGQ